MSVPAVVFLVVGLVTLAILAALLLGLINHLKILGRSLAAFRRETDPVLEEIRGGAAAAQATSERLQANRARMQEERERIRTGRSRRRRRR